MAPYKKPAPQWVRPLQVSTGAERKLLLFFLPFAGGRVDAYKTWMGHVPAGVECLGLELPGHGVRTMEPFWTDGPALFRACADAMEKELEKAEFRGLPWAVYGHSMGTVFAVGVTRTLQERGVRAPARVFVSGRHAPNVFDPERDWYHASDEELIADLKDMGSWNEALEHKEIRDMYFPVIRADSHICHQLLDEAPALEAPISLYWGTEESGLTLAEAWPRWRELSTEPSGFRAHLFQGGHMLFFNPEQMAPFLRDFRRDLEAVLAKTTLAPGVEAGGVPVVEGGKKGSGAACVVSDGVSQLALGGATASSSVEQ